MPRAQSAMLRYGVAFAAVTIALVLRLLLTPLLGTETPFLLFFAGIMIAAWYGGGRAGTVATLLAIVYVDYFFLSPDETFVSQGWIQNVRVALFGLEGFFASWLVERVESALRSAASGEERFRLLVDGTRDYAFFMLDCQGRITTWNAGAERIFGYTTSEILDRPFACLLTLDDIQAAKAERELAVCAATGRFEDESWRVRKDGSVFWANEIVTPLRDKSGRLQGFSKITRDISERKRAEEALRAAADRLRSIVDHVVDGIIIIGADGVIESANPAAEHIFGYRADEIIGQNVKVLMPEPYRGAHDGYLDNYLRTGEAQVIGIGREVVGQRHDGSTFPMDLGVSEFSLGTRRYFTGIVRDITERKQAEREALREREERLRLAIEATELGTWDFNPTTGHLSLSDRTKMMLDLPPQAEADREMVIACLHPEDRPALQRAVERAMDPAGTGEYEVEYRVRLSGGEQRWIRSKGQAFFGQSRHRVTRFIGTSLDVTKQKLAEEALREADRRKDAFLAQLAHELRNPLAPMSSAVQLLKRFGSREPAPQRATAVIERQLGQMSRLVDDLLDVSRITRGKIQLREEIIEASDVVASAIENSQPLLDARRHKLEVSLPAQPLMIYGDRTRLAQVLGNLLNNAAKYTHEGGEICLTVLRNEDEIVFEVRDNGIGIPAEMLPEIFELFTQVGDSLGQAQGGLGIGLNLVRSLVELHGGRVEAFSAGAGCGSTFVVVLPAINGAIAEAPAEEPSCSRSHLRRILIVDDNVDATLMLSDCLELSGHCVWIAHDGPRALEAVLQFQPDVVLLDIGLPGMSGYEVADRLRKQFSREQLLLIAITGYGTAEARRRCMEVGFDHHLIKPVNPDQLESILASCMVPCPAP